MKIVIIVKDYRRNISCLKMKCSHFCCYLSSATNSKSVTGLMGNDTRQKAAPSVWAKKYVVVEIPPYCRQRGGGEEGNELFGESWSPMVPSSERDSGEAMDCSSSLEEEEERGRAAHMYSV